MNHPRVHETFRTIKPVLTVCEVTRSLYGYNYYVVNNSMTARRFANKYEADHGRLPTLEEIREAYELIRDMEVDPRDNM